MNHKEILLDLGSGEFDTQAKEVTGALGGLEKVLSRVKQTAAEAFATWQVLEFFKKAANGSEGLSKDLLVLRLRLGSLRVALGDVLAPLGHIFIPLISKAVLAVTRFAQTVGDVLSAVLGMDTGNKVLEKTTKTVTAAGKAAKASLASFDQLQRLNAATGTASVTEESAAQREMPLDWDKALRLDRLRKMLEAWRAIDLTKVREGLSALVNALKPIDRQLFDGLEWAWYNILVPLAKWTVQEAVPKFLDVLREALAALATLIHAVKPAFTWLWENFLAPVASFVGTKILEVLELLRQKLQGVGEWIWDNQSTVENIAKAIAAVALTIATINGALSLFEGKASSGGLAAGVFGNALGDLISPGRLLGSVVLGICAAVAALSQAFSGIGPIAEGVGKAVTRFFKNMKLYWQSTVNAIIGYINGLITAIGNGINAMIRAINKVNFKVPDWVPGLGGKKLGFSMQTVSMPQIPYLARGAVLPANKPFMAMVGDQRHGTNVEAPLATIQEAVAVVMQEQTDAILAGFEASVGVQKEILEAVLGISIGDEVIGSAVARYNRRHAVTRGGVL